MSESGQGRPDSFASTLKVQRSAAGSGSGRHETAPPMSQLGRFETLPWLAAQSPTCGLAQVPPADLDIPILAQLAPSRLPCGTAFEPGPLEVVRLDALLRGGPFRQ